MNNPGVMGMSRFLMKEGYDALSKSNEMGQQEELARKQRESAEEASAMQTTASAAGTAISIIAMIALA